MYTKHIDARLSLKEPENVFFFEKQFQQMPMLENTSTLVKNRTKCVQIWLHKNDFGTRILAPSKTNLVHVYLHLTPFTAVERVK